MDPQIADAILEIRICLKYLVGVFTFWCLTWLWRSDR